MLSVYTIAGLFIKYLIITHALYATPFCLLLLASFIETIPKEIEESALIDGASVLQVIFRIILPLSLPGIATAAIYTFLLSWNDFAFALVIITSDKIQTVPLAINRIFSGEEAWWGPLLASSIIATIPVLIIFLIFERYLVSGLTLGAVKR
jgi:multiple sugar transport system permease protein